MQKIIEFFNELWETIIDFLLWLPIKIFDLFLDGIATVIEAIPQPEFIAGVSLGEYIPDDVLWLANQSGVSDALAIILGAVIFKFLRRVLTLGIW